jgi:hypothetical protein
MKTEEHEYCEDCGDCIKCWPECYCTIDAVQMEVAIKEAKKYKSLCEELAEALEWHTSSSLAPDKGLAVLAKYREAIK